MRGEFRFDPEAVSEGRNGGFSRRNGGPRSAGTAASTADAPVSEGRNGGFSRRRDGPRSAGVANEAAAYSSPVSGVAISTIAARSSER